MLFDKLDEIMRLADKITVLRDGRHILTDEISSMTVEKMISYMAGMVATPVFQYDFGKIMNKEVKLHTVFRYQNLYEAAIHTVADYHLPLKKIVTNMYTLHSIKQARRWKTVSATDPKWLNL